MSLLIYMPMPDFAGGNLGDIIREVEAPIRQQTAQTDTDVLRRHYWVVKRVESHKK